jgi:putative transposase
MRYVLPSFDRTDDIIHDEQILRFEREWENGDLSITRVRAQRPFLLDDGSMPTIEWFLTERAEGRLVLRSSKPEPPRPATAVQLLRTIKDDSVLTPSERKANAKFKAAALVQFVCKVIDDSKCSRSNKAIDAALAKAFTPEIIARYGKAPPGATARKWLDRTLVNGRDLERGASKQGQGSRTPRHDDEVKRLQTDAALHYWSAYDHTFEDAYAEHVKWVKRYSDEQVASGGKPAIPYGRTKVRGRINELESYSTWSCKYGKPAADDRYRPNGAGNRSSRFAEVGIIDHQTFDAFVALEEIGGEWIPVGRPTVTATMDDFTTCIVSGVTSFTPPSIFNMLEAIKWANRPKMHRTKVAADKHTLLAGIMCRFDTILPDNAWEFTGSSGQDSLIDLGSHIDWSRAGMPKDKAKLERFWRTLGNYLAKKLPGATFDTKIMKDLGYDPTKQRVVLATAFRDCLAEAIAFYNIQMNDGIGAQPARLWEKEVAKWGAPPVIRDDGRIDQLMGKVVERTLTPAGIELLKGLTYNESPGVGADSLLSRLSGKRQKGRTVRIRAPKRIRVKVKYNPVNLAVIQVWADDDYVTLRCTDPDYARNLSEKHHETILEWVNKQNLAFNTPVDRALARATLNQVIRDAAPWMAMRHRKKVGRLLETDVMGDHVPSEWSDYGQAIPHNPSLATRSDGGAIPAGPGAGKRKPSRKPVSRKPDTALPVPDTGSSAKVLKLPPPPSRDKGGDWTGL